MATCTDPATELSAIAERLSIGGESKGAKVLADQFGVPIWSTAFMRIVTCILERADLVEEVINRSQMDEDHKRSAAEDLESFKSAFTGASLNTAWNNSGGGMVLLQRHGNSIKYMASTVRPVVAYPKLSEDEVIEMVELIDRYLSVLDESDEPEFVRRAIADGLSAFRFQLVHLGWMGSGYAVAAFREVLLVYAMVHRETSGETDLDAASVLSGLRQIITRFQDIAKQAKGWTDTVGLVWKGYQLASTSVTTFLIASKLSN